jgi:hypothetical protein
MAGEVAGKICEAAVALSLDLAGIVPTKIHWGKKPKGMSITTDIILGDGADHPSTVILVTHSISAMQSHKKFWRNIGELVELKCFLKGTPTVINIVFGQAQMKKLSAVMAGCMDKCLFVGDLDEPFQLHRELRGASAACKGTSNDKTKYWLQKHLSKQRLG